MMNKLIVILFAVLMLLSACSTGKEDFAQEEPSEAMPEFDMPIEEAVDDGATGESMIEGMQHFPLDIQSIILFEGLGTNRQWIECVPMVQRAYYGSIDEQINQKIYESAQKLKRISGVEAIMIQTNENGDVSVDEKIKKGKKPSIEVRLPDSYSVSLYYIVHNNQQNILSIVMLLEGKLDDEIINGIIPCTFDATTGEQLKLNDIFDEDANWQGRLMDEIDLIASTMNFSLLGEIPAINEDNYFYIADKTLVLVYEQYELGLSSGKHMTFHIPFYQIRDLLNAQFYDKMIA